MISPELNVKIEFCIECYNHESCPKALCSFLLLALWTEIIIDRRRITWSE